MVGKRLIDLDASAGLFRSKIKPSFKGGNVGAG